VIIADSDMMLIIKPILLRFLLSDSVRQLVIDLLEAYAKSTDNTIDDAAVELVKNNIFRKKEEEVAQLPIEDGSPSSVEEG